MRVMFFAVWAAPDIDDSAIAARMRYVFDAMYIIMYCYSGSYVPKVHENTDKRAVRS